jgi:elongation factor 1-beta
MERMKAKAAAAGKDKKKDLIAKSLILWEVKPWEAETDLDEMARLVLSIQMDGLEWKTEYKKEPIAYGVYKLVIGAVVEDEKVSTDDVQEKI